VNQRRDFIRSAAFLGAAGLSIAGWADTKRRKILVMGDSLSAEYGIRRGTGWVALLEKRLAEQKIAATVVNGSISGETTSGGKARIPALLATHKPTHVIVELGGNDALRGLPLATTRANLTDMVARSKAIGAKVLILGMQVPPNWGASYAKDFEQSFATVAKEQKVPLVPFFLKGVADAADPTKLFQADRLHPLEAAHPMMLDNVWPELKKLLA
jgi:acyl-CoA thioesterase I